MPLGRLVAAGLLTLVACIGLAAGDAMSSTNIYAESQCSGAPLVVSITSAVLCDTVACSAFTATDGSTYYSSTNCWDSDRATYVDQVFDGSSYLMLEMYSGGCELFMAGSAYAATGKCHISDGTGRYTVIAKLNEDGSASLNVYNDTACGGKPYLTWTPDSETVASHSCSKSYGVFHVSTGSSSQANSSSTISSNTTFNSNTTDIAGSFSANSNGCGETATTTIASGSADDQASQTDADPVKTPDAPSDGSGGVSLGAIIGIVVAYLMLCVAAGILCMEKISRFVQNLVQYKYPSA